LRRRRGDSRQLLLFLCVLDFLHVFGRLLLEVLQAVFAAKFDFLPFVREDVGLAVLTRLLIGDDALVERVGLRFILSAFCASTATAFECLWQPSAIGSHRPAAASRPINVLIFILRVCIASSFLCFLVSLS
jgi:hypothetical protein